MKSLIVYAHGKGGSAQEAVHYKSLFPKDEVIGFDYRSQTPWQAKKEFFAFFTEQRGRCEHLTLVANSIGAFFALSSLDETFVFCAQRVGSGNFSLIRNSLPTKGFVWQTYPTAGSISCTFPLNRPHRCQSFGNARSIRRLRITVLSCITPTSVPTSIIGYQGYRK